MGDGGGISETLDLNYFFSRQLEDLKVLRFIFLPKDYHFAECHVWAVNMSEEVKCLPSINKKSFRKSKLPPASLHHL